jgi:hypothetical protein
MTKILRLLLVLISLTLMIFCPASAQDECGDPCGKPTPWDEFNQFELKVTIPGKPGYSSWKGVFDKESLDIKIEAELSDGAKITKSEILMVGGRVLAIRGDMTETADEIDVLDAPIMQQQLVLRLLGAVLPGGPEKGNGAHKVDYKSDRTGIQFATPSAQGFISAPWRVSGNVKILAPNVVEYQLQLTAAGNLAVQGKEYDAGFEGRLAKTASATINDSMSLSEWKVFDVGVQARKEGNGTTYDYGAAPTVNSYKVVSDIRKKLAEERYPGERDQSKDFTGFWKEDCDQAFGLQIMPYGTDGKYSIVFCGPGGCGQPSEGRITFITKDSHYEVIGEDEIRERTADGWETYHRCTRETHPILKYKEQRESH